MWVDLIEFRVSCAGGLYIQYISPVSSNCRVFLRRDETSPSFLPSFLPFFLPLAPSSLANGALLLFCFMSGYSKWFIYRQQRRHNLIGTSRNLVRRLPIGSNKFRDSYTSIAVFICIYQLGSSIGYSTRAMDNSRNIETLFYQLICGSLVVEPISILL